ncbi:MAG TPA: ATP-binding protein [Anaerolineae bacterium]|nr:ATP-binding protein [Anaerolineae bacterium]
MVTTFNNYKVGTKILIGYVIALALMAAVIVIAILRIYQINDTVANLAEGLAAEQHLADQVVTNVWATHFYALQYMDQQNPADLGRYRAEYAKFDQLLAMADQRVSKQARLAYLDDIKSGIQTYGDDFTDVIGLLTTRNRDLLVDLDQQGRLAEIKLEQIRANSFFADDTVTSYQAGNAQRALLLMRVAAFQYLESGDPYWIDEFNRNYESAQTAFHKLDQAIQSQLYQELTDDAEIAVDTYVRSFADIQENYTEQQDIITNRLNVVGPNIREAGAAISADVATDFQAAAAATQSLATRTQWLLLVTMGLAIVAALGLGLMIARSITGPLEQVTEVAHQIADLDLRTLTSEMDAIAQGDLTRHLTITTRALSIRSGDEIGQMARTFNMVIRQLQKAGTAFSDMAANLRRLTERNARLFQQAQKARQKAEAASQAKSNFLASMSHELRTPLNAILGYAQILRRDQSLPASHAEGLAVIQESGQHLLTLINDILDLAKIEAGKLSLHPTVVHLPTFLDSVVGMMKLRAQEKGLQFVYEPDLNLPYGVEVDEKRLRQVLINLLSNAIKFTPGGTVTLQAKVVDPSNGIGRSALAEYLTRRIRFMVSDTGIGIEPDQLELIFQPFEQLTPGAPAVEGAGLGLPISQQLVRAMGSEIQVESEAEQGSAFWFELLLPVIEVDGPADPVPTRPVIGYDGPPRKILIVDDKTYNLALLVNFLKPLGFETTTARNGEEAITQALQLHPDLIILDMLMPVKSGPETIEAIRCQPEINSTVIIGTSASVNRYAPAPAAYDDFLPKPVDFDRLTELLGRHLQLTWRFEDEPSQQTTDLPADQSSQTPELIPPPVEELNALYDLAMKGNMPGVYKRAVVIEQMSRRYHAFTQQLKTLAKAFDEESVLALVTPYLEKR